MERKARPTSRRSTKSSQRVAPNATKSHQEQFLPSGISGIVGKFSIRRYFPEIFYLEDQQMAPQWMLFPPHGTVYDGMTRGLIVTRAEPITYVLRWNDATYSPEKTHNCFSITRRAFPPTPGRKQSGLK